MQFYKNLKRARVRMGKSQIEVAKAVGISNAALSNYETGYREPDLDTLCALSRYYGLTLDELLDVNGEQHKSSKPKSYRHGNPHINRAGLSSHAGTLAARRSTK